MFMGHYAAALAGKAIVPRAPLWSYVVAAEVLDIVWSSAIIAGVERVRFSAALPGAPLLLDYMPWSHSLPAAIVWATVVFLVAGRMFKLPARAAVALGLVTFSHFACDFLVHRPDLALGFDGRKVGLSLWNTPVLEEIVELGGLVLAAVAWGWRRGKLRLSPLWPLGFLALLLAVQILSVTAPLIADPVGFGVFGLVIYLGFAAIAAVIDRIDRQEQIHAA